MAVRGMGVREYSDQMTTGRYRGARALRNHLASAASLQSLQFDPNQSELLSLSKPSTLLASFILYLYDQILVAKFGGCAITNFAV